MGRPVFRRGRDWPLLAEPRPQGAKCPVAPPPRMSMTELGVSVCAGHTFSPLLVGLLLHSALLHLPVPPQLRGFLISAHECNLETWADYHPLPRPQMLPSHGSSVQMIGRGFFFFICVFGFGHPLPLVGWGMISKNAFSQAPSSEPQFQNLRAKPRNLNVSQYSLLMLTFSQLVNSSSVQRGHLHSPVVWEI